jgi:hypothetical protein
LFRLNEFDGPGSSALPMTAIGLINGGGPIGLINGGGRQGSIG